MRLNVTTKGAVYGLSGAILIVAIAVSLVTSHAVVHILMPAELVDFREMMLLTANYVSVVVCLTVAAPFSFIMSNKLLMAHQLQEHITLMAKTDHLTGLPNRAAVLEQIEAAVAEGVKLGQAGSALFVDLDHFKKINDTYGHAGGDAALRHAATILRTTLGRSLGKNAIMGRFGGEEFVCFIDDAARAPAIAAEIITTLRSTPVWYGDQQIAVKASIGLANTDGSDDTKHLLSRADEALYIAKSSGRDCIVSYDEVALLRLVAASIDKPLRRRSTDIVPHLSQQAA